MTWKNCKLHGEAQPNVWGCPECLRELREENKRLSAEVQHWQNNHATEVRRARVLKERTDMPLERVQAYEKWGEDQRRIVELEEGIRLHLTHHENGCTYLSHLLTPNAMYTNTQEGKPVE